MILEQHYLACLAQASYFIADQERGKAVVVDPRRDVDLYVERARELGVEIERVLLTHMHADFLAGHLELAERTGAKIALGAQARTEYPVERLSEGDTLMVGDITLKVLETPGHTPESISILVFEPGEATKPYAVLTGDTLFIGDVGRPDLVASKGMSAEQLAGMLYDSLHDKLLPLPDETIVYPGHGAGSACGKNLSSETFSTMGKQRALNYALQPMSKQEFVATLTSNLAAPPAYFPVTADLNAKSRATLESVLASSVKPLSSADVLAHQARGAQVLDTRSKDDFASGHLPGSINIGLDGKFASWAGALLDLDRDVVLVASPGTENEAALRLGRIGFDRVVGFLEGGATGAERVERIDVHQLSELDEPCVVDVRTPTEHANGHLAGSRSIPLPELRRRASELPTDRKVYIHCQSGYRSMTALSLLADQPQLQLVDVAGGFEAWSAAALPIEVAPEACAS